MVFWKKQGKQATVVATNRLRFEQLETKRLLAIVWANEFGTGGNDPEFNDVYGVDGVFARALVNRAIDDWNAVITDQNFDNDDDPETYEFSPMISAEEDEVRQ